MSSATLVVRQYETASGLSERFGCALIDIIKVHQHLPGAELLTAQQLATSRAVVVEIVSAVERALLGNWGDTHAHQDAVELPEGFAAWLQATHQGDAVRPEDLARVRAHLGQVPVRYDDADLAVLDRLSRVIDAQAAHLFRRLTHAAGSR